MTSGPLSIEAFPELAAAASRAVVRGNFELAVASIDRMLGGGLSGDILLLRQARFDWRFYLARQDREVMFFFVRSSSPAEVVLDATASLRFEPLPVGAPAPMGDAASYRWVLPPFVLWPPTPEQIEQWSPSAGAIAENTIFLVLGPSRERVLAAHFSDGERTPHLAYVAGGSKATFDGRPGSWPLGAVLDLLAAVRAWAATPSQQGTEVPFTPAPAEDSRDVERIVVALAKGWIAADAGSRMAEGDHAGAIPELALSYGLAELDARVLLRLRPDDGGLATSHTDDPLQLALQVHVGQREATVVTTAAISPPDFLAAGRLHEAFGALVRSEPVVALIQAALRDPQSSPEAVDRFLGTARWIAFRVARFAAHDTDVLIWEGVWNRRPSLLVLRVDVVVASDPDPSVRLADEPRLTARMLQADAELAEVGEEEATYFVRLLLAIYRWRRLVS